MDGQEKPGNLLPVSSFLFVFLALGLVLVSETPFRGTRPDVGETYFGPAEGVRARLWEDPFAAVERSLRASNDSGENAVAEHTHRCQQTGLDGAQSPPHSLTDLHCQLLDFAGRDDNREPASVTVLAVMVFGGPYEGDIERRMRSRYAVLSGLDVSGYVPRDADHIGYLDTSQWCDASVHANEGELCGELPKVVPYEWFTPRTVEHAGEMHSAEMEDALLVLWLDDNALARQAHPLQTLAKLHRYLKQGVSSKGMGLSFKVLGPAGSENLRNIYEEKVNLNANRNFSGNQGLTEDAEQIALYSSAATVPDEYIHRVGRKLDQAGELGGIIRTISTDRAHAQALICELERRGVDVSTGRPHLQGETNALLPSGVDSLGRLQRWT